MNTRRSYLLGLTLIAASAVASALAYPTMPERMAVHWNAAGAADDRMARPLALALLPAVSALVLGVFAAIPRIDPLGENVATFRETFDRFAIVVLGLLTYAHLLVLAWNARYRFEMLQALAPALGALTYATGVLLDRAKRNWFIGIRTPWTLSDDEVWRRTHERAAPLFKLAAPVVALGALAPEYGLYLIVAPLAAASVYATVYSYLAYRRVAA